MVNKKVVLLTVVIASLSMLGGCSQGETVAVQKKQVTVDYSWWGTDKRHQYSLDGMQIFETKNQDIRVKSHYAEWSGFADRVALEMASHTQADVMQINYSWLYEYTENEQCFYDLEKLSDELDLSGYSHKELEYGTIDGVLRALPIAMNVQTVYYNKSIYDSYGLELPVNWDDLFAAAEVMRPDGIYPISVQINQTYALLVAYTEQVTGKKFMEMDGTVNFTEEDFKIMLEMYKKLIDEKVLPHIEEFDKAKINDGTFAGSMAWVTDAANFWQEKIDAGDEVVIGSHPRLENSKRFGWYLKPASMYTISIDTENPKEAAKLLDFLVNDEDMARLQGVEKGVPINRNAKRALEDSGLLSGIQYEADRIMNSGNEELELISPYFENAGVINAFKEIADQFLYDQMTLEECARSVYEQMVK